MLDIKLSKQNEFRAKNPGCFRPIKKGFCPYLNKSLYDFSGIII